MDTIKALLVILMSSVLVNNYVLNKFLGICPFLGVSKKLDQAAGMGTAVTFVMLVATAVTWPIQTFVLDKLGLGYLQTIVFILVIATLVQFVEIILKKIYRFGCGNTAFSRKEEHIRIAEKPQLFAIHSILPFEVKNDCLVVPKFKIGIHVQ